MDIIGLDYTAVLAVAAVHSITVNVELFAKLRLLELDVLIKRAESCQNDR